MKRARKPSPPWIPSRFKHEYTAAEFIEYIHKRLLDQVDRHGLFSNDKVDTPLLANVQEWRAARYASKSDTPRILKAEARVAAELKEEEKKRLARRGPITGLRLVKD